MCREKGLRKGAEEKMKAESKNLIFDKPRAFSLKSLAKHVFFPFKAVLHGLSNLLHPKKAKQWKYKVSICGIFKNEAPYMKEWIEFHKIVGIDHFYLYNNFSDDDYLKVLSPYIKEGIVTLIDWPIAQGQIAAYQDCVDKFNQETEWLGFIDFDEFVVPKETPDVYSFLSRFSNRGSVLLNWRIFGTSGRMDRDKAGLVTEDFTVCWPKLDEVGKCFLNNRYKANLFSKKNALPHHLLWTSLSKIEYPPVNVFGKQTFWGINRFPSKEVPIQINHYFTKSRQEYIDKIGKGDVYFANNPKTEAYFYRHEELCSATDYSAYRFLVRLKCAMGRKAK